MKTKALLSKALTAFVLVSIGFAGGKEFMLRSMTQSGCAVQQADSASTHPSDSMRDKVVVYYMHATFRCNSCNSIEEMAEAVVESDFADALAAGRLEWRVVNFNENVELPRRYGVSAPTVVVVKIEDGQEAEFQRLDEVWTHVNSPDAFKRYIRENIQAYLDGGRG